MSKVLKRTILQNNKITDYLSSKGINPVSSTSNKKCYRCPFHSEKTGSFFVYNKGDYEDYNCFGCKANGNIITFIANYEKIPYKDVITRLSEGIKIDNQTEIESIVRDIIEQQNNPLMSIDPLEISFLISDMSYRFLEKVNFDDIELSMCEKLFETIDDLVYSFRTQELDDIKNKLPEILSYRFGEYSDRILKKQIEEADSLRAYKEIL